VTIDDLEDAEAQAANDATNKFLKSRKTRDDQHELYDTLTNIGLSSEYADEYINMLLENN